MNHNCWNRPPYAMSRLILRIPDRKLKKIHGIQLLNAFVEKD